MRWNEYRRLSSHPISYLPSCLAWSDKVGSDLLCIISCSYRMSASRGCDDLQVGNIVSSEMCNEQERHARG